MKKELNKAIRKCKEVVQELYLEEAPYYKRGYYMKRHRICGKRIIVLLNNSKIFGNEKIK